MIVLSLATGFFLGVRHCFEPDHLTAVAHFASAARSPREGLRSGLLWGLGHAAAVLLVGLALSGLPRLAPGFEAMAERGVGATLIVLAAWRWRTFRRRGHVHEHGHDGGLVHTHAHAHHEGHVHAHIPALTGLVHGAAGAAGIAAALSFAAAPVSIPALAAAFGAGTLAAMGAAGWLSARLYASASTAGWERPVVMATILCGFTLGVFWIAGA
jgi:ABC-type nickel/cobalt efflux system permease component RcnA